MNRILLTLISALFLLSRVAFAQTDLDIESAKSSIVIDGEMDGIWTSTPAHNLESILVGNATTTSDFSANFRTLWDADNLYVLVDVTDESKINDSDADYQDDAIEIYIDINNDKLSTYGPTDYQYTFAWNKSEINANGPTDNFVYKLLDKVGGYVLEVKMPWATLALESPSTGELLGFDVHVHDDDDGGDRDNKLAWFTTLDESWNNPSLFATASLVGELVTIYPAEKPNVSVNRGFYNNPFDVTITSPIAGMSIYYTLDGSDPRTSPTSQVAYAPVVVRIDPDNTDNRGKTPAVVLRTSAKKQGYDYSPVVTRSYIFVEKVKEQTENPGHDWPEDFRVNQQEMDLVVDPTVIDDSRYTELLDDALLQIPTISIVTDNSNLFSNDKGIYVNAQSRGAEWERPASIELINPDGSKGFQSDFGLRIRGGYSRNPFFRKHAFRLFFRDEYGAGKLNYKLFGDEGASSFDKFDLRCSQNYSWSKGGGEAPYCTFNRDVFSRDIQRNMGEEYTRSRYYHLYLNGQYWGLYQSQERSEARFAATYYGGDSDDYDVVKRSGENEYIEATDGNLDAWQRVWDLCEQGFESNNNYYKLQGLDANGVRDTSLEVLVDIDNFIDYMNIIFYTGNFDAPVSSFVRNTMPNNFYAIRSRKNDLGFQFFAHDNEHTLQVDPIGPGFGITENRVQLGEPGHEWDVMRVNSFSQFHPQWLHHKLAENAEYRARFGDRAYELYFNDGVLTPEKTAEVFIARTTEYDTALIAESARWGDVDRWTTYTKDDFWQPIIDRTMNEYFPQRTDILIGQLQEAGLLSTINVPEYRINNQVQTTDLLEISAGTNITLRNINASGSIRYTVDGSDPRLAGGTISSKAINGNNLADQSIWQSTIINSRIYDNGEWSSLHTIKLVVDQVVDGLQITEIHYNPYGNGEVSGSEYEFVELKNSGSIDINLTTCSFDGIQYTFNDETIMKPGDFIVLASNATEFQNRYGFAPHGEFEGQLDNGGERISLMTITSDTLVSVKYNDKDPWPTVADGLGFSIVPATANPDADWDKGSNWRASAEVGGSPGADDIGNAEIAGILVNEVLHNSEQPLVDAVELYNPTNNDVNIGNWYLSDNRNNPQKWQIPTGTIIPANGYVVFYEGHYEGSTLAYGSNEFGSEFSLNSHGEEVYLFSANSSGVLTGYEHGFDFGDADPDVAFGRHVISTGNDHFVAMTSNTLGAENAYPKVGPVVINQIMYHPLETGFDYIQLVNITNEVVNLYEPTSTLPWIVSGINFTFPYQFSLQPGEAVYLVESAISPNDFRFMNNLGDNALVYNYPGSLSNSGEELLLQKSAPQYEVDGDLKSPYIHVDKVDYNDKAPWPDADGNGFLLQRTSLFAYGNDPANWEAVSTGIAINAYQLATAIEGVPYNSGLSASGGLTPFTWSIVSGSLPAGLSLNPETGVISGIPAATGSFDIEIEVVDAQSDSDQLEFNLLVKENTVPIAFADSVETVSNYYLSIDILSNDTDNDGDRFNWEILITEVPVHGTVVVNPDQTITYLPETDFVGSDELTYQLVDINGTSDAKVFITVKDAEPETGIVDVQVQDGNDDAEQNVDSGQLWTTSSDLELIFDNNPGGEQIVGIRFQNIDIPQGAIITAAYIQFTTDETGSDPTLVYIQGENEDLALPFDGDFNISNRPLTNASVAWDIEPWEIVGEASNKQKTPDLSTIVQEVINRSGWTQGNALAFIITGSGTRTAESFNGDQNAAPKLHIEFATPYGDPVVPVADAGIDQFDALNATIQLDGSNSYSSDDRALNYKWELITKPETSLAALSNPFDVQPTFVADVFGTYAITLYVSNGVFSSVQDTVVVVIDNATPVANAGSDQQRIVGTEIMLNGSSSYDPEGVLISYRWRLIDLPTDSKVELSDETLVNPRFTPDLIGTYKFSLTVSDGFSTSEPDEVVITITDNQVPIANAGKDKDANAGEKVTLDGSESYDPEAVALTFTWSVVSTPAGAVVSIANNNQAKASFEPKVVGVYVFSLTVSDGANTSTDQVTITVTENLPPVADAGGDVVINLNQRVDLYAGNSYDPEGDELTYLWTFITKPNGSNVWIFDASEVSVRFRPDRAGVYILRLDVSDGQSTSSDQIQITVQDVNAVVAFDLDNSIRLYPNPFYGKINVEYDESVDKPAMFELYTISGALIQKIEIEEPKNGLHELSFDKERLHNGVYLMHVKTQNGASKVFRITYNDNK